ncbi:MAG: hypothetical protein PHG48_09315, partial [Eubacteriales bacterium]|nr:hypothetical protein [Eubacteriales bacterium]
ASVETAGKPPADAVGQYVFAQYEVRRQLSYLAHSAVKFLNSFWYKAMYTFDLMGIGTQVVTPRGYLANSAANALAAAAAGLGELTYNGMVYSREHGINQVFVAIVTDARIENDIICSGQPGKSCCGESTAAIAGGDEKSVSVSEYCASCGKCIKACPVAAIPSNRGIDIKIELNGKTKNIKYIPIDTKRCDWSCKYALCGDDGFKYVGSRIDEKPPKEITEESIAAAVAKSDPVLKFRGVTAEKCIVECTMASRDFRLPGQ